MVNVPPGAGSGIPWINAVLAGLGANPNGDNDLALALWAQAEGAPDWRHNWLNTTMPGYGGYSVNSAGVRAYPTFQAGVRATVATLRQPIMSGVAYALTSNVDIGVIYEAINKSPWCAHCQGGHYPVTIYNYLQAHGQSPVSVTPGSASLPPMNTDPPAWDWSAHVRAAAGAVTTRQRRLHGILNALRHL